MADSLNTLGGSLPAGGSQPDLTKLSTSEDDATNITTRKRKQPELGTDTSIMHYLADFRKDIMAYLASSSAAQDVKLQNMHHALTSDIKSQISSVMSKADQIIIEQTAIKTELSDLNDRVTFIEKKNDALSGLPKSLSEANNVIKNLVAENDRMKQYSLLNNIEISGVPFHKGENLFTILSNISSRVGYTLSDADVDSVHRVRRFQTDKGQENTRPAAIIVRFTQRRRKDALLAAVRARRGLTTADIDLPGPATPLFLGDHLTPANKLLLKRARQIKIELNYSFLWTRDCKIFMRKNETSKIIHIHDDAVLTKLK
ncbi:uncharacterized protein LOC133532841 [Cydia pomonella]|uniref:uncharacterized protein LOC133532841 n=1 Tax=Cydia pomonella TaxID=82600 RepID=UPI002ADD9657|nr:uncharacterized protein LOC133532841 [Cydia pomonella]